MTIRRAPVQSKVIKTLSKKHLENVKLIIEILSLITLIATVLCYLVLIILQGNSNEMTSKSLKTMQKALIQSQKSNEISNAALTQNIK